MAQKFLEAGSIWHNFKEYSLDDVRAQIEKMREDPERAKEAAELEHWCEQYKDQFPALYRIKERAVVDDEKGESLSMTFGETDYHPQKVDTEKNNTTLPSTQLELVCTFENGTSFGLSAMPATPKTADQEEPQQLRGEIRFPEETLKALNEEKFKRIMDFCRTYGFSTFGLHVSMRDGEIDVDEELAKLLAKYQEEQTMNIDSHPFVKPSEDENSDEGFRKEDFYALVDEAADEEEKAPEAAAEVPTPVAAAAPTEEEIPAAVPVAKKRMSLDELANNMRLYIENDLQKRKGLSYWEHSRTIDGRRAYVFSLYDTENRDNYHNDGRKTKDGQYKTTASCRLMISQDRSGKFFFGYATPNGAPMKDSIAGDFLGEIKKTGTTHLNFKNIPNQDKVTWLNACAEKGIVPTGISLAKNKIEAMLQKAQAKLSTEEYATFVERLMDQWEEDTAKKGKTLAISDQEYIRKCRNDAVNKREDQYGQLEKAEFEQKFKPFRDAYGAPDGLLRTVNKLVLNGGKDTKAGAATALAAVSALSRTFDIVLGTADNKKNALDMSLGERLDELSRNPVTDAEGRPILIRITEEEKRVLAPLASKRIKNITKEEYKSIFDLLYKRQLQETKRAIIERIKEDKRSSTHVAPHLLIDQKMWGNFMGELREVNAALKGVGAGVDALTLPDKHSGLPLEELKAVAEKEYEAEKAAKEAAKPEAVKPAPKVSPAHGRE